MMSNKSVNFLVLLLDYLAEPVGPFEDELLEVLDLERNLVILS